MRQVRAQEDAIIQAQNLKEKTDMMFRDYEKTKSELNYTNKSKEDVLREVDHLKNQNRLYENKVHEQSMEQDRLR